MDHTPVFRRCARLQAILGQDAEHELRRRLLGFERIQPFRLTAGDLVHRKWLDHLQRRSTQTALQVAEGVEQQGVQAFPVSPGERTAFGEPGERLV